MSGTTLLQKWRLLQAILADQGLSPSAKLIAARLLYHHSSQTGRCSPSYQTLAEGTGLTRRTVIASVRELEAQNWISVARVKGGDPAATRGFVTNGFVIAFNRLASLPPSEENDTSPSEENSTPGVKETHLPGVSKTTLNSEKDTGKGNREESPPTPSRFEAWWEVYPRKVGKDDARRAFLRNISDRKATADEMIAGARRYAAERQGEPETFTKHPKTWLAGGCWADQPAEISKAAGNRPRRPFSAIDHVMREFADDE